MSEPFASGTVTIQARPADAFRVISDPRATAEFAEELAEIHWLDGATEAAVGRRFKGVNRNGRRRWTTVCEITELVQDRCFAYDVRTGFGMPISRWRYDIEPAGSGCTVTESNWLRAPFWFVPVAILVTGILDRRGANGAHITATLRRLKAHLEDAPA